MADGTKLALYCCFGLAALGAGSHTWLTREREQADKDRTRGLQILETIASQSADITALRQEMDEDEWFQKSASSRQHEFFSNCAKLAGLPKGPSVGNRKDTTPSRASGFKDGTYELTWRWDRNETKGFERERLAQFLWRLEEQPSLKVTMLQLNTEEGEWNDLWEPRVEVTERKPEGKPSELEG